MKFLFTAIILLWGVFDLSSKTIFVGDGELFNSIEQATSVVLPGDTILIKEGIYNGGLYIENLQGKIDKYIHIIGENGQEVIIRGGSNAIQFTDPNFLVIENLIFEQQTGNAVNIDDGGSYETPAKRLKIQYCIFRDMDASGNNDLLKLSGLDTFEIVNCIFENGSDGGSGVDMVGCHQGRIEGNVFMNMGSNAIQAKGGTQNILIQGNYFENCGQRTLNLGGSTGLDFFRPIDAKFEAADIAVWSNVIIGSVSPINYVGSIRVDVANNTIINPEKWVMRILQETVDESRFYKCSQGRFHNNIIYLGNLNTETNIGPNTAPEEFSFSNNFWYNHENQNWDGPYLPTAESNQITNSDPMFSDFEKSNFNLKTGSKAIGYIKGYSQPITDFFGNPFSEPRSAGAIESIKTSVDDSKLNNILIFPNPTRDIITISAEMLQFSDETVNIEIYNVIGTKQLTLSIDTINKLEKIQVDVSNLKPGVYLLKIGDMSQSFIKI